MTQEQTLLRVQEPPDPDDDYGDEDEEEDDEQEDDEEEDEDDDGGETWYVLHTFGTICLTSLQELPTLAPIS